MDEIHKYITERQSVIIEWNIKKANKEGIIEYSDNSKVIDCEDTWYVCSLCGQEFYSYREAHEHVLKEHFDVNTT